MTIVSVRKVSFCVVVNGKIQSRGAQDSTATECTKYISERASPGLAVLGSHQQGSNSEEPKYPSDFILDR